MHLLVQIFENGKLFLILFGLFFTSSVSDPRATEAGLFCQTSNQLEANNTANFNALIDKLAQDVYKNHFGINEMEVPPHMYALGQCYGDLSAEDCSSCFSQAGSMVGRCSPMDSARIYLDGCFLRNDTYDFFKERVNRITDSVKCGYPTDISKDAIMKEEFGSKVAEVVSYVTNMVVNNDGFAVTGERGGVEGVYALAQCWKSVDKDGCKNCLDSASERLRECVPAKEGRALFTGCYVRYSTERFYNNVNSHEEPDSNSSVVLGYILAGVVTAAFLCILAILGARLGYEKLSKRKQGHDNLKSISISSNKSKLNFKYEMLEKATNYLDASRKLGQGGGGSVFKGTLPDGRTVAVKRLFFNTRQWADEFFNEVNLISGVQHKNLVGLLGCSIEGPESLLVYEFLPDKSLDRVLFVKDVVPVSWQQRFDIICGIAQGLSYLHGGCGAKIIHRDIKTSNILLDEGLTPKIADFGLARSIASGKSHISTGIAGTLGYMAPEYLVRGQLTEKADVYAFGVLVLEIACGRKNTVFTQGPNSVLHSVWKKYKANHIAEAIDPILNSNSPPREASNVLQIGLLCTQASVSVRPSMSDVVQMLTGEQCIVPSPKQPPFLNASILSADDTTKSLTMNNVTGGKKKITHEVSSLPNTKSTDMVKRDSNDPSTVLIANDAARSSTMSNITQDEEITHEVSLSGNVKSTDIDSLESNDPSMIQASGHELR